MGIQTPNLRRLMDRKRAVYPCILHLPALHPKPGIPGNGAVPKPLRRAHP